MTNGIERNLPSANLQGYPPKVVTKMSEEVRTLPFYCGALSNDEDDFMAREDDERVHSPTDNSEDSVEVKISPISGRNKRKCAEPRRVQDAFAMGPLKKRICLQALEQQQQPFRPWSVQLDLSLPKKPEDNETTKKEDKEINSKTTIVKFQNQNSNVPEESKTVISSKIKTEVPNDVSSSPKPFQTPLVIPSQIPQRFFYHPPAEVETNKPMFPYFRPPSPITPCSSLQSPPIQQQPMSLVKCKQQQPERVVEAAATSTINLRVPIHPQPSTSTSETEKLLSNSTEAFPKLQNATNSRKDQRNYKNMTRERRIEANARERTRVHTISAAFDTLRKSIPAYSHNQKLSKLSVLRIACSYIMTLSNMVQDDSSAVSECVASVTSTIQREGKPRKKKD